MNPEGIWRSEGYGWILELSDAGYVRWQEAGDGAYLEEQGSIADLEHGFDRVRVLADGRLALHHAEEITQYTFRRLGALPASCSRPYWTPDPLTSFEVFARLFDEHYPFFELRGLDWSRTVERCRALVRPDTSEPELLRILGSMVGPLADNHVTLDPGATPDGLSFFRSDKIQELRSLIDRELDVRPERDGIWGAMRRVGAIVAEDLLSGRGASACNGLIHWGEPAPGIGYLAVLRLFGLAETEPSRTAEDLPRERVAGARFLRDDLAALHSALDRALGELKAVRALILDLRMNGGGFDRAALVIAERLVERRLTAFYKRARCDGGLTAAQPIELVPEDRPRFGGPVYLLTSRRTASAAEVLVLALLSRPQVTRIGEPTLGILSDNLYKRLPNGWEVGLSNELYEAADGRLYEASGIAPDVEVPVWVPGRLRHGYRAAFERALELGARP